MSVQAEKEILIAEYRALLRRLLACDVVPSVLSPSSVGSAWGQRGRPFRELVGERLSVKNDDALLSSAVRPINVGYAMVSSAWIILGRDDLAPLSVHNANGVPFSVDGFTLSGAFGKRLRGDGIDQIGEIVTLLRQDPSTRRAIAFIGRADDLVTEVRDFPCASSVQFFRRTGRLDGVVYMRSQSLFGVFPYDLVNFRHLLKWVAAELELVAGILTFVFGSVHLYVEEEERVKRFLEESDSAFLPLPGLPVDDLGGAFERWTDSEEGKDAVEKYLARATAGGGSGGIIST